MLKINCLLNTLPLKANLQRMMEFAAADLVTQDRKPTLAAVYNEMFNVYGVEVDIQTLGGLYVDSFGSLNDPLYDTRAKVEKAMGRTTDQLAKVQHRGLRMRKIGRDAPAVAVAASLMKMLAPGVGSSASVQRAMQDALLKWATRKLGIKTPPTTPEGYQDILARALDQAFGGQTLTTDPGGLTLGTLQSAKELVPELQREMREMLDEIRAKNPSSPYVTAVVENDINRLAQLPFSLLLSTREARAVMTGILAQAHERFPREFNRLTRTITREGPNGVPVSSEVMDWKAIIKATQGGKSISVTLESLVQSLLEGQYAQSEIDLIKESLRDDFNNLLQEHMATQLRQANERAVNPPKHVSRSEYDRLAYLFDVGIFHSANKAALLQLAGANEITADQEAALERIMRHTGEAYRKPVAEWSPTFRMALHRVIENELELIMEAQAGGGRWLKGVRGLSHFLQIGTSTILTNIYNATENLVSGIRHTILTTVRNEVSFLDTARIMGDYFMTTLKGAPKVGVEVGDAFDRSGNVEARYNLSELKRRRMGAKDRLITYLSLWSQAILSATDAAFKGAMLHQMATHAMIKVLAKQAGISKHEATILINEALHGGLDNVESIAQEQLNVLQSIGIPVSPALKRRLMAELAYYNLVSDGQAFSHFVNTASIANPDVAAVVGKLPADFKGVSPDLVRAVQNAAIEAAGRSMGHRGDTTPVRYLFDQVNTSLLTWQKSAVKDQNPNSAARAELAKSSIYAATRFRSGGMRWWWMTIMRNPIAAWGYIGASHVYNNLGNKNAAPGARKPTSWGRYYNFDEIDLSPEATAAQMEKQFTFYLNKREQFTRLVVGSAIETMLAPLVLNAMLAVFGDAAGGSDDERHSRNLDLEGDGLDEADKEVLRSASQTEKIDLLVTYILKDANRKRWFNKMAPSVLYNMFLRRLKDQWDPSKGFVPFQQLAEGQDYAATDLMLDMLLEPNTMARDGFGDYIAGGLGIVWQSALSSYSGQPLHKLLDDWQEANRKGDGAEIVRSALKFLGGMYVAPASAFFTAYASYRNAFRGAFGEADMADTNWQSPWQKEFIKQLSKDKWSEALLRDSWLNPLHRAGVIPGVKDFELPEDAAVITRLAYAMPRYAEDLYPPWITHETIWKSPAGEVRISDDPPEEAKWANGLKMTVSLGSYDAALPELHALYEKEVANVLKIADYAHVVDQLKVVDHMRLMSDEERAAYLEERSQNASDLAARYLADPSAENLAEYEAHQTIDPSETLPILIDKLKEAYKMAKENAIQALVDAHPELFKTEPIVPAHNYFQKESAEQRKQLQGQ